MVKADRKPRRLWREILWLKRFGSMRAGRPLMPEPRLSAVAALAAGRLSLWLPFDLNRSIFPGDHS